MPVSAIIEPKKVVNDHAESLNISISEIGVKKLVIVSWLPHIVELLREAFGASKSENWLYKNNPIYSTGKITIGHIRPGAPAAAIYIEQLIAAGAKKIITIGYAGALVDKVSIGDVIVANGFISSEGTSKHYSQSPKDIKPTQQLLSQLQSLSSTSKLNFGKCWNTDALFRETADDVKAFGERGALCVDMETSACVAVCNFREVETCNLLLISDLVYGDSWVKGFSNERLHASVNNVVKLVVTLAS